MDVTFLEFNILSRGFFHSVLFFELFKMVYNMIRFRSKLRPPEAIEILTAENFYGYSKKSALILPSATPLKEEKMKLMISQIHTAKLGLIKCPEV